MVIMTNSNVLANSVSSIAMCKKSDQPPLNPCQDIKRSLPPTSYCTHEAFKPSDNI